VVLVHPVAEVQPGHVHPGLDEGGDLLRGAGRRPEGADDLGAAGHADNASGVTTSTLKAGSAERWTGRGARRVPGRDTGMGPA
jgi:hypothetical protein